MASATTIGGLEGCRCSEQELLDKLHIDFPPDAYDGVAEKIPDEGLRNNFENGFGYAKMHGIYFEKDYQWVGWYQRKQPNNLPVNLEKIYVKDFISIDDGNQIVEQLEKQPLAGAIISTSTFQSWGFEVQLLNNNGF